MPKSLNPVESQEYKPIRSQAGGFVKTKPKTTVKMVEDALIKLHNAKGVTLKQIYSYLLSNYNLQLITRRRVILIKKYLKSLWESEDVVNKTGNGLLGHFKLVDKKVFSRKIKQASKKTQNTFNAIKKSRTTIVSTSQVNNGKRNQRSTKKITQVKNSKQLQIHSLDHAAIVIPRQATPMNLGKSSIFSTPIVPTEVQSSTPVIRSLITRAPEIRKRAHKIHKKKISQDDAGTPRSSLPEKRRKLLNLPEK